MKLQTWLTGAILLGLVAMAAMPFPGAQAAEEAPVVPNKNEEIELNLSNVMMSDALALLSQWMNKPVAASPRLARNEGLSIIAPNPVTREEAIQLLIAELKQFDVCLLPMYDTKRALIGYTASDFNHIFCNDIPVVRWRNELPRYSALVTYVREIHGTSAQDLSVSLRSHCSNVARVGADDGSQTLLITDYSDRIGNLMDLLDTIDPEPKWDKPCEIKTTLFRNDNSPAENEATFSTMLGLSASTTWKQLAKGGDTWYDATLRIVPRAVQGIEQSVLLDYYVQLPVSNSNSRQGVNFNGTLKFDNHDMQRTLSFTIGNDRFTITLQWTK